MIQAGESLYALPALLAACVYAAWATRLPRSARAGAFVAFGLAFALRMAAFAFDLKMPVWLDGRRARRRAANGDPAAPLFEQLASTSGPVSSYRGWS